MKNKSYKPVINRAIELGCTIEYGSKHAKVFGPKGNMIIVLSVNSSRECYDVRQTIRKIEKALSQ